MENLVLSDTVLRSLYGLGLWLTLSSLVTYGLFRLDRRQAERGRPRLPEINLLWLATFGGWPGALVALRQYRGLRFSGTFRGWLRGIVAAELLFLGLVSLPQGSLVVAVEGVARLVVADVSVAEREARPGRLMTDTERRMRGVTNIVPLSARP